MRAVVIHLALYVIGVPVWIASVVYPYVLFWRHLNRTLNGPWS